MYTSIDYIVLNYHNMTMFPVKKYSFIEPDGCKGNRFFHNTFSLSTNAFIAQFISRYIWLIAISKFASCNFFVACRTALFQKEKKVIQSTIKTAYKRSSYSQTLFKSFPLIVHSSTSSPSATFIIFGLSQRTVNGPSSFLQSYIFSNTHHISCNSI